MRSRALILLYHRVAPASEGPPDYSTAGMVVTPTEFDVQMRFVARTYAVVPLARIADIARGTAPMTPSLCAVTFDDGWRDVHEHALPVLRRYRIPATVFVATGPVDRGEWFWEERTEYTLALLSTVPERAVADLSGTHVATVHRELRTGPADALAWRIAAIVDRLARLDGVDRDRFDGAVDAVLSAHGPGVAPPFMTWAQLRELAAAGVELGNHTASHPDLRRVPRARVIEEIQAAARRLAEEAPTTGDAPPPLAYPYGSQDADVRDAVREAGARLACTARTGYVTPGSDVLQLCRINICSQSAPTEARFAARMLGLC